MNYFDEILYLSKRLLKYESVYEHGGVSPDAVLGKTIVDCLKDILDYCETLGLKTYLDPQGMYAYAETGQGEDYIGILTHLDVVPAGDLSHWEHPPFEPVIIDGKLLARGAADDKVPAAIAVLAVKKLIDEGIEMPYPIRIIFGSDEETGFRGVEKYKKVHKAPKYTLVMDGTFPFSYAEKHLLNYELHTGSEIKIHGGQGYNSVMDHVVWDLDGEKIEVEGKSAHASRPLNGESALVKLAYMNPEADKLFSVVNRLMEPNGHHKLGIFEDNRLSEETTMCFGMVRDGVLYADLRTPAEVDLKDFTKQLEGWFESLDIKAVQTDLLPGSFTDTGSDFSKTVLKCYQDITGDLESQPFKTGSATYGRSFDENCLSFGPRMNYHITNTHKPNEFITFDLIENAFAVYVHTLKKIEEEL